MIEWVGVKVRVKVRVRVRVGVVISVSHTTSVNHLLEKVASYPVP